jgi:hypothetical protein
MHKQSNGRASVPTFGRAWSGFTISLGLAVAITGAAYASDGSASVYPAGAETVMPGRMPGPGSTMLDEFSIFYDANELASSNGRAAVPGFHLRVSGVALKLVHNWGLHVLGGTLVSTGALPFVDIYLNAPFGSQNKIGFSNPDLETSVAYVKGALSWWYGFEVYTPGFSYNKNALVNVGQHNYATAPSAAFTYMPNRGRTEVSSKFQYIVNYTNDATQYRSGNEFVWEYDAMRNITKHLAVGGMGHFYKQTTNDLQSGLTYLDGNRGRDMTFGPEIRYHLGHWGLVLKYEKDFLVQNKTVGNTIWFEFGVPLGTHHE